jgi:uncharacterized protein YbcI
MPSTNHHPSTKGSLSADISNAIVRLLSEYTGRGPTKARTYIDEDLITVVLRDTLTKGERSLYRDGEERLVLANRKAFQNTMASEMIAAVERLSGRRTIAFLSDNHIEPDIAIESFVLAPPSDGAVDGEEAFTGDRRVDSANGRVDSANGHVYAGDGRAPAGDERVIGG